MPGVGYRKARCKGLFARDATVTALHDNSDCGRSLSGNAVLAQFERSRVLGLTIFRTNSPTQGQPSDYATRRRALHHQVAQAGRDAPGFASVMEALLLVAEKNGPTMFARIGVMRVLNRQVERSAEPSVAPTIAPRREITPLQALKLAKAVVSATMPSIDRHYPRQTKGTAMHATAKVISTTIPSLPPGFDILKTIAKRIPESPPLIGNRSTPNKPVETQSPGMSLSDVSYLLTTKNSTCKHGMGFPTSPSPSALDRRILSDQTRRTAFAWKNEGRRSKAFSASHT
jgi:hypothetical protein